MVEDLEKAHFYASQHFPHVLDFVQEQKQKKAIENALSQINDELKNWQFFSDTEKKQIEIEKVLEYGIKSRASDVHITAGKTIAFRIEGVLIKMENEPKLTKDHMDQIKKQVL